MWIHSEVRTWHNNKIQSWCHFGTKSQFFFQTLHHSSVSWGITLLYFFIWNVLYSYALDKRSPSKSKFSNFGLLAWKLTKLLMSFFKPRVSFPWNFESLFSFMTHNSYGIFQLKHYMLWTKRTHQSTIFQTFECPNECLHPISHAIFETTRSGFIQILHHCLVSGR